jgi:hypothetical protein
MHMTSRLLPPALTSGKVKPLVGSNPMLTPTLIMACIAIQRVRPYAR